MKLAFGKTNQNQEKKWRNFNPFIVAGRTYLLADDIVYRAINHTAEKIERKTGISKTNLAIGAVGTAELSNQILGRFFTGYYPSYLDSMAAFGMLSLLILTKPTERLDVATIAPSEVGDKTIKICRHIFNVLTIYSLLIVGRDVIKKQSVDIESVQNTVHISLTAIGFHLVSRSNGMIDRFKKWITETKQKITEYGAPQPVTSVRPVPVSLDPRTKAYPYSNFLP